MKTVYLIIAFCGGLFLGNLLFSSGKEIKPPDLTEINKEKKQIDIIDTAFSVHQIAYQKQNDSLLKELRGYKFLLANAKKELSGKRETTFSIVNRIKHDTLFRADTLLVDSLQEQITSVNAVTDSIITRYRERDSLMQQMVAIRDTQIVLCDKSFNDVAAIAHEQVLREQKLTEDLNSVLKQQKRKRNQNRFLSAGLLFVSGIAATLYIKSKP